MAVLGCIADDFTGATDLAQILVANGMSARLLLAVPSAKEARAMAQAADALVICLKIRTAPVDEAVAQALAALRALGEAGCTRFVWKYCSTFDSTPRGNIGPVADALREALGARAALVCPAFPENARTVYQGMLFVGAVPLNESSMRHHPLTPMTDANLLRLLAPQTPHPCGLIPLPTVRAGVAAVRAAFEELAQKGVAHVVADALEDADLRVLGRACADHQLITGGSGIARELPAALGCTGNSSTPFTPEGPAVVLAGSCSQASLEQVRLFSEQHPALALDPLELAGSADALDQAETFARKCMEQGQVPLVYGSAEPERVRAAQEALGREKAGAVMEAALAELARRLRAHGARRLVVAGGETSGAVVTALGLSSLRVGEGIAPGVPWTATLDEPPCYLALKSGNFGGPRFFFDALHL